MESDEIVCPWCSEPYPDTLHSRGLMRCCKCKEQFYYEEYIERTYVITKVKKVK